MHLTQGRELLFFGSRRLGRYVFVVSPVFVQVAWPVFVPGKRADQDRRRDFFRTAFKGCGLSGPCLRKFFMKQEFNFAL